MNIQIVDNFLSEMEYNNIIKYVVSTETYSFGEYDIEGYPVGAISELENDQIIELFQEKIEKKFPAKISDKYLYRAYINCFIPGEQPFFHFDSNKKGNLTFLFYPCPYKKWNPNIGGETQFFDGEKIIGIPPIPNRMICFDGTFLHKATTFRNIHRFTIALKYFLK